MSKKSLWNKSILTTSNLIASIVGAAFFAASSLAIAEAVGGKQSEPVELLIKFDVVGYPTAPGTFTVGGPGYAPITTNSGAVLDNKVPGLQVATLSNAQIVMTDPLNDEDGVVDFTCLAGSCNITLNDGSVLVSDGNLPLSGRMPMFYGTMHNDAGDMPVRILGCGGLNGIAGPMQGMVGSICFNGVFNVQDFFNGSTNPSLTGGSNCTITMHTPLPFPTM